MVRRSVVRPLMIGALVTGLGPLTGAGVGGAAAEESPAGVCSSMFGEQGPADASVAGEGPSGDPMPVTIAWNPSDWPAGLRDVITCVSVDGRAVPSLAAAHGAPPNAGTFNFDLTLPVGGPGVVVCQQSVLIGAGSGGEQRRPTNAMCFKLRGGDASPAGQPAGPAAGDAPATPPDTPPARTHAPTSPARPDTTPPARVDAGAPAVPVAVGVPLGRAPARPAGPPAVSAPAVSAPAVSAPADRATPVAPAPVADRPGRGPVASANPRIPGPRTAGLFPGAWGGPWARDAVDTIGRPARNSRAASGAASPSPDRASQPRGAVEAPRSAGRSPSHTAAGPATRPPAAAPASEVAGSMTGPTAPGGPDAGGPRPTLARTGITDRVPLAAAGSLLALGGAAIVLGEPRRRTRPARAR